MRRARIAVTMLAKDFNVVGSAKITKDTRCMVKFVSDSKYTSKGGRSGAGPIPRGALAGGMKAKNLAV